MRELFYFFYSVIGIGYWAVNIFIRKLHLKNDPGDGWFIVPVWVFLWPICLTSLLIGWISDKKGKI